MRACTKTFASSQTMIQDWDVPPSTISDVPWRQALKLVGRCFYELHRLQVGLIGGSFEGRPGQAKLLQREPWQKEGQAEKNCSYRRSSNTLLSANMVPRCVDC